MDRFLQDVRFGWRQLTRAKGFTLVATVTLAVGIAANTVIFSVVDAVLLRPLPYRDPRRLVAVFDRGVHETGLAKIFDSYADFELFQRDARSFEAMAAATWAVGGQVLTGRGPAREILAMPVTAGFFDLLGVRPALGRTFAAEDTSRGCSVVLSDGLWRSRLGADPHIVGQGLMLNQQSCTVVGVMSPGFAFYPAAAAAWTLLTPGFTPPPGELPIAVFGRLRPGVTREAAESELSALHTALHQQDGRERDITPSVYDLQGEFTWLAGRTLRATLLALSSAVALVLFVACLNVASLLLGRSFVRAHEMGVRAALGAGRGRLARQSFTESILLSSLGGTIGVAASFGIIRYVRTSSLVEVPPGADLSVNGPVLVFAAVASLATAVCFGCAPALAAYGTDITGQLKTRTGGAGSSVPRLRWTRILVAAEAAGTVLLVVGAGLLMRSVVQMRSAPMGIDTTHLATARVTLPRDRYPDVARRVLFFDELSRRLRTRPDVQGVAVASALPPMGAGTGVLQVRRAPASAEVHDVARQSVSDDYFRVLGMTLRRGRFFDGRDREDAAPVAIVNEALIRKYFPDRDALGEEIRLAGQNNREPWLTIVGVVSNEKRTTVYDEMRWVESPTVFRAVAQDAPGSAAIAIRTNGDVIAIGADLEHVVTDLDGVVPVGDVDTMDHRFARVSAHPEFRARVSSFFAMFALALAAIGLHGVLHQFTGQRTREIGIRRAMGARTSDIVGLVVRQGGVPIVVGLGCGVAVALVMSRYLSSLLYGVRPDDPATLGGSALVLAVVAGLAMALPAWRAAQVDPMQTLRGD